MNPIQINKRTVTLPASVRLREAGEGEGESRVLEGYALKFGVRSILLPLLWPTYEILERGCITEEMLREQRIYFTMYHNREIVLGRWDKGEGTLRLSVDDIGLKVECELPRTPDGDTAMELVRRGDLSEMSFIYYTMEDDEEHVQYEPTEEKTPWGERIYLRHVKKILGIFDVTIAANPAYEDTEIQARESQVKAFAESLVQEEERPEEEAQPREEEPKADKKACKAMRRKLRSLIEECRNL